MNRHLVRLVGMTFLLAVPAAAPAHAANELGLSLDQKTWTSSISTPLFDPDIRWVPGDSESATFYVRNHGGDAGDLTVDVLGSTAGNLIDSGDLHITAKGGGGDWTMVSTAGRHRLLSAPSIPDGHIVPIKVNVLFDAASVNPTQLRSSKLSFHITLSQSTAGSDSDQALPDTGAPDIRLYAALSAILLSVGVGLVRRRSDAPREVNHV